MQYPDMSWIVKRLGAGNKMDKIIVIVGLKSKVKSR